MNVPCPHCHADLRGGLIPGTGVSQPPEYYDRTLSVEIPSLYDGGLFYECPDCGGRWHRWSEGTYQYDRAVPYVDEDRPYYEDGPDNDDWIHDAYERQHPIKPERYYDGGRLRP